MSRVFEQRYASLRKLVDARVRSTARQWRTAALADACTYVLTTPGKRVRSVLLLLSCEAVGGRTSQALDAAAAVEIMHSFTLVHDDIMDNATTRRGKPTVHKAWDMNTALLVGDVVLGLAYARLLHTRSSDLCAVARLFTDGLLQVCDGQGLDLEFERRRNVTVKDYFAMIERKTAALFSLSTQLGGIIGGGTSLQTRRLRDYGTYLGRAFQLQDDLLDVVAERKKLGKNIGGDILEGKKTYLLLNAIEHARGRDRAFLKSVADRKSRVAPRESRATREAIVRKVTALYTRYDVMERSRRLIRANTDRAIEALSGLPHNHGTEMLQWFAGVLVNRNF